ncbi:hypothetical protein G5714_012574 [Onychostoma macrolepis]|uniref:Uncharacterized protein n=1 Tax=Onychostoma macrolepis TaxID=369639 RepID=A0A7J6CHI8_9TELE|nr:hypothetical protein G5714_012574 [Onychostoma macrolepis]
MLAAPRHDKAQTSASIQYLPISCMDNAFSAKRGLIAAAVLYTPSTPCILIMDCCHSRSYHFLPLWLSYTFSLFYFKHKTSRGDGTYAGIHTNLNQHHYRTVPEAAFVYYAEFESKAERVGGADRVSALPLVGSPL